MGVRVAEPHAERTKKSHEHGVALVAVLGFLAVMSLITIGIVGAARMTANSASRELIRAQAQAAVESGIDHAIAKLLTAQGFAPPLLTKPEAIEVGGFRVVISVRPEFAKVDLNYADGNLLAMVFEAGGADKRRAQAIAAAVEDWRDGDDLVRVNGAERRQYEDAGASRVPANRFFGSPDELSLVLGMNRLLYDCVRPEVTILAQRQGIDIDFANDAIRRVAGIDTPPLGAPVPMQPGDVFEITARLNDTRRGVRRAERAVVRITGNPSDPYAVLSIEPAHPLDEAAARSCPKRVAAAR